ncbi:MAG: rane protein of unknown function [Solirubrobacterales bacterium]|jgi:signal transduction histidine kinase|nr:rane protein of unknown function [Solirubrobacterales bacterium]
MTLLGEEHRTREPIVLASAALWVAVAVAVLARPGWVFVDSPALYAGAQTLSGLGALAAAWFALVRVQRTRASNDLALALAIGIIAVTSILLAALAAISPAVSSASTSWLPVPGRLAGSALLLVAGAPGRPLTRLASRSRLVPLVAGLAGILALCGALLGAATGSGHIPLVIQLATIALTLAGAASLARRAQQSGDRVLAWCAAAAAGLAAARLSYIVLVAPGRDWLSPGDIVRLAAAAFLLLAARSELAAEQGRELAQAVAEERRRLAREIHDGLAQELAFIVGQSRRMLSRPPDSEAIKLLAKAGQAALTDARRAIFDLKRPNTRALTAAIVESTFVIADRAGLALDVEVEGEVEVAPEIEHALLRIVNEAVSNAARHAHARTVSIRIACENDRLAVRITDDGDGFDQGALNPRRGFGLQSMAQRAESLGGRLHLESEPGSGTMIEVAI